MLPLNLFGFLNSVMPFFFCLVNARKEHCSVEGSASARTIRAGIGCRFQIDPSTTSSGKLIENNKAKIAATDE
jgi:hypothetical protein